MNVSQGKTKINLLKINSGNFFFSIYVVLVHLHQLNLWILLVYLALELGGQLTTDQTSNTFCQLV
jgi:hypothetical protein